jgi:hypothetical protein
MPGRDKHASEHWADGPQRRMSGIALTAIARALETESDRLSLWIPVLFGGGILAYFALSEEPRLLTAGALIMAASGFILAGRGAGLGLIIGGAALALAAGFANAKLHTEMARAPVLGKEMRGVTVMGALRAPRQGQGQDHAAGDRTRRVAAGGDPLSRARNALRRECASDKRQRGLAESHAAAAA